MPVLDVTALQDRLDALEAAVADLNRRLADLEGDAPHHYATVDLMQTTVERLATRLDRSLDRLSHDIRVVANRAAEGR